MQAQTSHCTLFPETLLPCRFVGVGRLGAMVHCLDGPPQSAHCSLIWSLCGSQFGFSQPGPEPCPPERQIPPELGTSES